MLGVNVVENSSNTSFAGLKPLSCKKSVLNKTKESIQSMKANSNNAMHQKTTWGRKFIQWLGVLYTDLLNIRNLKTKAKDGIVTSEQVMAAKDSMKDHIKTMWYR